MTNFTQNKPDEVIIIGAGLAGLMMSLYLAKRNYTVTIYEKTPHPSQNFYSTSKATDLNLTQRACLSLNEVGLLKQVIAASVSTVGRIIYFDRETILTLPHSNKQEDVIYNVNRPALFKILYDAAQKDPSITIHFSHELVAADMSNHSYIIKSNDQYYYKNASMILGCDGANSVLRDIINQASSADDKYVFLYKQFFIPDTCQTKFPPDWMYQWNDTNFIIVAHTDINHQLNCTVVCKPENVDKIYTNKNTILVDDGAPFNKMKSVKVSRQYADGMLLLGDAAHGMLPFLGQGVNSAFEDCRLLNNILNSCHDNWSTAIKKFVSARQVDTSAIIDMSAIEYTALLPRYDRKRQMFNDALLSKLHQRYPSSFFPYRYLLAFTHIPYAEIMQTQKAQLTVLNLAYEQFGDIEQIDWRTIDHFQQSSELSRCG